MPDSIFWLTVLGMPLLVVIQIIGLVRHIRRTARRRLEMEAKTLHFLSPADVRLIINTWAAAEGITAAQVLIEIKRDEFLGIRLLKESI